MIATILLQAASSGPLGSMTTFLPLILIVIVFYFFMIRPQVTKQKDQKKFANDLKKGDKVILTSGAHGKVSEIAADGATVLIEHESGHKTRYDKSAISLDASKALNAPPKV